MVLNSENNIEDLGLLIKNNELSMCIEYGSGGYEVKIFSCNSFYIQISNDLLLALNTCIEKAFADIKSNTDNDLTIPATPKSLLQGKDTKFKV